MGGGSGQTPRHLLQLLPAVERKGDAVTVALKVGWRLQLDPGGELQLMQGGAEIPLMRAKERVPCLLQGLSNTFNFLRFARFRVSQYGINA